MNSFDGFEFCRVVNCLEECEYLYGGNDFIINDEDIELLKSGKIINFSVCDEYGCTLSYKPKEKEESNE